MKKILTVLVGIPMSTLLLSSSTSKSSKENVREEIVQAVNSQTTFPEGFLKEVKFFNDSELDIIAKASSAETKKKNIEVAQETIEEKTAEYFQSGVASFYGAKWNGRRTANGEIFNTYELTAAHKTLAFGTKVKVTNTSNGKSVIVRINDRGPYVKGRVIDLSTKAFSKISDINKGVTSVKLEIIK